MSDTLIDNHGRAVNYVRLAVTDRCNLRCFYCMPEEGINYLPRQDLLTFEEMLRLIDILVDLGIKKLRITGGEPFLRKDLMDFLRMIVKSGLEEIHLTTNGSLTSRWVPELKELGITSVNLSLDTIHAQRFRQITRRDQLTTVLKTLDLLLKHKIPTKINMVVMGGKNEEDILAMAELARTKPIAVRYIEEMPFNGVGDFEVREPIHHHEILSRLQASYPSMKPLPAPASSTSARFAVDGFKGTLGIIAAYSRTFCGTCNRLRITPQGTLRTCLYAEGVFNIRDMMREGASDFQIKEMLRQAVQNRAVDGFEAEQQRNKLISESMSTIGG